MFSSACSIFIGAPQAQSTLESQRKINETGAIYKCDLDDKNTNDEHCQPFSFDLLGNRNDEKNDYTYNAENKDYQWLGATMDGGELNTDKMVVSIIPTHITEIFPNNNQKKNTMKCSFHVLCLSDDPGMRTTIDIRRHQSQPHARRMLLVIEHNHPTSYDGAQNSAITTQAKTIQTHRG